MKVLVGRLFSFGSLPLLASLAPLLLLGIVSRASTPAEWDAFAVGQATGSFATAATMFGWQVVGPPAVALATSEEERRATYAAAWWLRLAVFVVIVPAATAVSVLRSPEGAGWMAAVMCISASLSGMSMTWYAIGVGRARLITSFEVLPRMASLAAGAGLVVVTGEPLWYGICLIVGLVLAQLAFHRRWFSWTVPSWPGRDAVRAAVRLSAPGAGVLMLGGVRSSAPVLAATTIDEPNAVVRLSSADRLYRYSLFSVSALGDALQNWVLEHGPGGRRQWAAIALHVALGVVGATGLAVLGPWSTGFLWGASAASTFDYCVGYAVAFFFVSVATPLVRNLLVPQGLTRHVLVSDVVGLGCGAAAIFPLIGALGGPGIAWALAVAEGASAVGYLVAVVRGRCLSASA